MPFDLPDLIEPGMVEIAVYEVLNALASGRISPRRAGVLLHGLQLADKKLAERPLEFATAPSFQGLPSHEQSEPQQPPSLKACAPCDPAQPVRFARVRKSRPSHESHIPKERESEKRELDPVKST